MNFYELKHENRDFYPAILLDRCLSKRNRKILRRIFFYFMILFFVLGSLAFYGLGNLADFNYQIRAAFILLFTAWFQMYLFNLMYLSYYLKESDVDFEVLKLTANAIESDVTLSFIRSEIGSYTLARLGITSEGITDFLKTRTDYVTQSEYEIIENDDNKVTFAEFGYSLVHFDSDFSKFLKKHAITAKDFKDALDWTSRISRRIKQEEVWWSKDKLARIPSVGKAWSFGQIYYLEKFGHSIYDDTSFIHLGDKWRLYVDTISKIEKVLAKDKGANIVLTARETETALEALASFGKTISLGTTLPQLENKRIYLVDSNQLLSAYENVNDFEKMFSNILYQSAGAGNIILVFPHFSDFVENASKKGLDVKDQISEIMNSTNIQVVVVSNQKGFHETLETDLDLMRNFEKVAIEDLDYRSAILFAEDEVLVAESKSDILFTYQAVVSIVESADRYFSENSISDKISDIVEEIRVFCEANKIKLIKSEHIAKIVEIKTGIPIGILSEKEKDKLSKTEMLLKQRVISQDKAIESITDAMKRARLGVANPKRPLGSFMFVGPTGVGKTETSKALAEVFFEDEENMIRIDMSEFNSPESVSRLIGDVNSPGILSSKIRDKQYGVLLVDEFEKAHDNVHNLFLQILDEGYFSDGTGERVNCRNLIIIATSNAGSDLIYKNINKGINFQSLKQEIIDYLIANKLFRPEFLNRFDDVVLFNPLDDKSLELIVSLIIKKLNKRLEDKGLDVKTSDDLIKYLVSKGQNKEFGAREINRVIQKEIETKIAEALINGQINKGDTITSAMLNNDIEIRRLI